MNQKTLRSAVLGATTSHPAARAVLSVEGDAALNQMRSSCSEQPRFKMWQTVSVTSICDNGPVTDVGFIQGVAVAPPGTHSGGWWYFVHITEGHFVGFVDEVPEDEISPLGGN